MADFTQILADVAALKAVVPSVVAVVNGIADQVDAAVALNDAGDNTQLTTLAADIREQADALAAAVPQNTGTV